MPYFQTTTVPCSELGQNQVVLECSVSHDMMMDACLSKLINLNSPLKTQQLIVPKPASTPPMGFNVPTIETIPWMSSWNGESLHFEGLAHHDHVEVI